MKVDAADGEYPAVIDDNAALPRVRDVEGQAALGGHAGNRLVLDRLELVMHLERQAIKIAKTAVIAKLGVIAVGGQVIFVQLDDRARTVTDDDAVLFLRSSAMPISSIRSIILSGRPPVK